MTGHDGAATSAEPERHWEGRPREWMTLARACVDNGHGLHADAELLLANGRIARALSLAVLAIEEYGKACQVMAVLHSGGNATELNEYRRLSRHHGGKIAAGQILHYLFDDTASFDEEFRDTMRRVVDNASTRKMQGFYVDRTSDGLRVPTEIVRSEAAEAIEVGRVIGDRLAKLFAPVDVDVHAEQLWRLGPQIAAQMERVIEDLGASEGEVLAAMGELLRSFDDGTFGKLLDDPEVGEMVGALATPEAGAGPATMTYLGVDLAWAVGSDTRAPNETGLVLLAGDGTVVAAGWARGLDETLDWIDEHCRTTDVLAFVDAPLVVTNASGQRLCETQVGQRYGRWNVSANSTNLASRNAAGVTLLRHLEDRGWRYHDGREGPPTHGRWVSECYPYTTLVGVSELGYDRERPRYKRPPKALPAARWKMERAAACDELISRLASLVAFDPPLRLESNSVTRQLLEEPSPTRAIAYKHREDLIDAALCAWTAAIWHRHGEARCQVLGAKGEDDERVATIIAPARPSQRR